MCEPIDCLEVSTTTLATGDDVEVIFELEESTATTRYKSKVETSLKRWGESPPSAR